MSLTAIINLAERLLNNSADQQVERSSGRRQSQQTSRTESDARVGDQFTPSAANQQDAGLFKVNQISFFSAAADFLLAQTLPPQANLAAAAAPANAAPTAPVAQTTVAAQNPAVAIAANPVVAAPVPAVNTAQSNATPAAAAAVTPPPVATTAPAPANSTQSQLLALNTALYALGLNNTQLAQVDQVASLIQVFNPLAFTSLVYQLEALAQTSAQQAAAPIPNTVATGRPAPTANTSAAAAPTTGTTTGNAAGTNNPGGFQIQELVIKFSGVQESFTQTGSGAQGGNTSVQLSAFNLQVEEINLTLANQAGQSLQVTAPQAATLQSPAPAAAAAQAKSAAA
jgi:hypothetical protein